MRQVRRRLPRELVAAEVERLAVGHADRLDVISRMETIAATSLRTGRASGAATRNAGKLPHSSASTCENAI